MPLEALPVKNCYLGQKICPYKQKEEDCLGMHCECLGCLKEQEEERVASNESLMPHYESLVSPISMGEGLALEVVDLTSPEKIEQIRQSCKDCCKKCHGYAHNSINHGVGCYGCTLDPGSCSQERSCFIQGAY